MLDHIGLGVTDYEKSKAFHTKAPAPPGYTFIFEVPKEHAGGFGVAPKPDFWIGGAGATTASRGSVLIIVRTTMARWCPLSTATTSRPSATTRNNLDRMILGRRPARASRRDAGRADSSNFGGER